MTEKTTARARENIDGGYTNYLFMKFPYKLERLDLAISRSAVSDLRWLVDCGLENRGGVP